MSFPTQVEVVDVTPRDGLQDAKGKLTTVEKAHLIGALRDAGVRRMEAVSFVSPKWMPKMADAEAVLKHLNHFDGLIALVPNLKGFERATASGIQEVTYVVSASPKHQEANLRMDLQASLDQLDRILGAGLAPCTIRGAISCAYGSPFEEESILPEAVADVAEAMSRRGIEEIGLADTVGIGTPQVVQAVTTAVKQRVPDAKIAVHFHDRYGLGQANVTAALMCGVDTFEAALGGLGGCPFAPDAPGNLNTEDLVGWLEQMGVDTGIDLEKLKTARKFVLEQLNKSLAG